MSERTIPTAPGWWWADVDGWRELVHVRDPWGRSLEFLFDCEEYSVDDERLISGHVSEADGVSPCVVWLAPVATLEEVDTLRARIADLEQHAAFTAAKLERLRLALACERGEPGPWSDAGWYFVDGTGWYHAARCSVARRRHWCADLKASGACAGMLDGIEQAHRALGLPVPWVSP